MPPDGNRSTAVLASGFVRAPRGTDNPLRVGSGRDRRGSLAQWTAPWVLLLFLVSVIGCQGSTWLRARRSPDSPLVDVLKLQAWTGPEPTSRTMQWLRQYDLVEAFEDGPPQEFIDAVSQVLAFRQTAENIYVMSETAFLLGKRAEREGQEAMAFDMYGIAVANAYLYLVDEQFDQRRNPYDPRFRQACDLYNGSLEAAMRLAQQEGPLTPGTRRSILTNSQSIELLIVSKGNWRPEQIERIEFASDYYAKGLTNQIRRFGLGVPLIAVYRRDLPHPEEQYYAPGMSVAATAFLRVVRDADTANGQMAKHVCVLELHDPLTTTDIELGDGRLVPLETDLSTPLAYSLSDPMFQRTDIGTRGLINPRDSQSVQGIYMLEPYDPGKVPVLMVHGLWSSLITWMEMFNDLRADPEIRDTYQFWFYLYPTGQPFWTTAAQLRQDLADARRVLDPRHRAIALDKMVLVGHSMGGLVSKLQTLDSRNDYWRLISDQPFSELNVPDDLRAQLKQTWFFEPNRSVRRVVTIATPHRGSEFSNGTTQWLARKLIRLPEALAENTQRLFEVNAALRDSPLLNVNNSVESLSPTSAVWPIILGSPKPPEVKYHNVVGVLPGDDVLGRVAGRGDGVVKFESAHLDDVESETIVPEDHVKIHRHPRTVLEVQRILLEHLRGLRAEAASEIVAMEGSNSFEVR